MRPSAYLDGPTAFRPVHGPKYKRRPSRVAFSKQSARFCTDMPAVTLPYVPRWTPAPQTKETRTSLSLTVFYTPPLLCCVCGSSCAAQFLGLNSTSSTSRRRRRRREDKKWSPRVEMRCTSKGFSMSSTMVWKNLRSADAPFLTVIF